MAQKQSDFIDVRALLTEYVSKWYLFLISVVVCVALGFVYTKIQKPLYEVRSNVLISQENSNPVSNLGGLGDLFGASGYVDDEIFIISSHTVYSDVVRILGLDVQQVVKTGIMQHELAFPEQPLEITVPAGLTDTLRSGISFEMKISPNGKGKMTIKYKKEKIVKNQEFTLPYTAKTPVGDITFARGVAFPADKKLDVTVTIASPSAVAEDLSRVIGCEVASKQSNVIEMNIKTTNVVYGTAVLNEIMRQYNLRGIMQKNTQSELTANFINTRLDLLAQDLTDAEMAIQNYKQTHNMISVGGEAKYQTEKRARLEEALTGAETYVEILKLTSDFINNPANAQALIPTTLDNSGVQDAIKQYNSLIMELMDLKANARGSNPALAKLEEQVEALRQNISLSLARVTQNANIRLRDLRREKAEADARLGDIPSQEREYYDLSRQYNVKQQLYVFLLQRREETSMLMANAVPKGIVVDAAYTKAEPLNMSKKMILLLAFFLGLCVPPVFLYLRSVIRNRFETRAEVERATDVPILGEITVDHSGKNIVVADSDASVSSELFRMVRSNLLFILRDSNDKVVLTTSTVAGEGKSFVSVNIAASLALLGKKVLLIGMDIRKPRLADYLGLKHTPGVTQYLSNFDVSLKELIQPVKEVPGLDVIVAGPVPPNPAELLSSNRVDDLFAQLRQIYDYIVIDSAPVGLVSDSFSLDRVADATVYVTRVNFTPKAALQTINDINDKFRLKKIGIVVNGVTGKHSYGYGLGYGYGEKKK